MVIAETSDKMRNNDVIVCVGVDGLLHECLKRENLTECGMPIFRKKIKDGDLDRAWCRECGVGLVEFMGKVDDTIRCDEK